VAEEPEAAQAQVSTVNPKHGLEGSPNAQAQVFTLSAVSGWRTGSGSGTGFDSQSEARVAKRTSTGFYAQCSEWLKNQRRFSKKKLPIMRTSGF
jgi:hypothetical protein